MCEGFTGCGKTVESLQGAGEKRPSGAKALLILLRLFGTAEAVRFQNRAPREFFRSLFSPGSLFSSRHPKQAGQDKARA
ncbi:hypothetical protein ACOBR2_09360 [Telmatobacter bradus]|uniref:hypothetical protein n=1 Tax=Telmatobacter bradus TaxID=474953 RepID=UPI003B42EA63